MAAPHNYNTNSLKAKSLGIDTYRENIIFIRADCHVCKSEGFKALTRIIVEHGQKSIIATLDVVHSDFLPEHEAGLSEVAFERLGISDGDVITVRHLRPLESLSDVRSKMYRNRLDEAAYRGIITDITHGLYSNIELAAFISACSGDNLDLEEIISLTKAMVDSGQRMSWDNDIVVDKHCVGGLPGNRTTPIVVAIIASAGLTIPKTSSRAITSPAGTADTMETITPVDLSIETIRNVVNTHGGCVTWGGRVNLSPADDILITVERSLDIDSAGQMIASVLSKKKAMGSTHVIIEIPVGSTAKVRTTDEALKLQYYLTAVGNAIALKVEVLITDGSQPVGRGIGPSLEAMDVLAVLRNEVGAPQDLREKALLISGALLELSEAVSIGEGYAKAQELLDSGSAWKKFHDICIGQGGFREPEFAIYKQDILADRSGVVTAVDNRKLARLGKLAGAPLNPSAGILYQAPLKSSVEKGQTLFTIYAEAKGELQYALEYLETANHIVTIQ